MNILLVSANQVITPYPVYPIGIDYVLNSIPPCHNVQVADMNTMNSEELTRMIITFIPDIVGISLRNIDNTDATDPMVFVGYYKELIRTIRKSTTALVVLGGSGFSIFASELMTELGADYGIAGEGERFSLFLDAVSNKTDPTLIPGILNRHKSYDSLSHVPECIQDDIVRVLPGQNSYMSYYLRNGGMLNLQSKRGCKYNCIYCTYPHVEGRKMRLFNPDEVGKTASGLQRAGAKYFFITDSTFNSDIDHSLAVAKAIRQAGVTIPWGAFFAPFKPPHGYFSTMTECGLKHVEFGTDSLSDEVLKSYRKPFRVNDVFSAHDDALQAGLHVAHFFVLGGPGETGTTLDETFSNVDKLKRTVLFFFCGMRIYPHTELYEIADKQGQITDSHSLLSPVFYKPDHLTHYDIINQVIELSRKKRNWIYGSGGKETAGITSKMYEKGYSGPLWEFLIR